MCASWDFAFDSTQDFNSYHIGDNECSQSGGFDARIHKVRIRM